MTKTLDIFRQDVEQPIWVGTAITLEEAKTRITELSRLAPSEYFVFDVASGRKLYETNDNKQSFCITHEPFGQENKPYNSSPLLQSPKGCLK